MGIAKIMQKEVAIRPPSAMILLVIITVFLIIVIAGTVLLSGDPNWARWHISYLGEGDKISAHVFNVSMWIAAGLVVGLAMTVGRELHTLKYSNRQFSRVKPSVITATLVVMGLCLYLIGLFPRSVGIFPHDIFGHIIYFAFLLLCLASPWVVPGMKTWFYVVSYGFHAVMLGLFIAYWTGLSASLYAAEVATFVFFLGWLGMLLYQSRRAGKREEHERHA